jgi:hypothetical protein
MHSGQAALFGVGEDGYGVKYLDEVMTSFA